MHWRETSSEVNYYDYIIYDIYMIYIIIYIYMIYIYIYTHTHIHMHTVDSHFHGSGILQSQQWISEYWPIAP